MDSIRFDSRDDVLLTRRAQVSDYSRRTMATSREHGGGEAVGDLLMLASRVHDAIVNASRASGARIA
jgi:hypothetical protein